MLAPMSAIAGRMAIDVAREHLGRTPRKVLVFGTGPVGSNAAEAARKAGAEVTVLGRATATPDAIEKHALEADLVVSGAFVAGHPTPKLLPRSLVRRMKRGAMIVDVSIAEGGIAETSRETSLAEPAYVDEGVIHYCVSNMPAARPKEAAAALSEAALPYVLDMGTAGVAAALRDNRDLRSGLLLWEGRVVHAAIAAEAGLPYTPITEADLVE
jgi:alanine dehydrogenase